MERPRRRLSGRGLTARLSRAFRRAKDIMFFDFFIRRPVFAGVCSIIVTLAGAMFIPGLPIAQYPHLARPQVRVTATYTGASADVVENAVTIPLEQEINGVEGMEYISSTSTNAGTSRINIVFNRSRDLEAAAVDVQNRVARAARRLPKEVNEAGILITKTSGETLLTVGLFSRDDRYDPKYLSNYVDVYIKDALKRVKGVAEVTIFGERRYSMRVWLDPTELARRRLTPRDVVQALQQQNIQAAAGQVGLPPSSDEQSFQMALRVRGRLLEPHEFEQIVLRRGEDGAVVRLGDVARAELGAEDYSQHFRFNGRPGVGLNIEQLPDANALEVRDGVVRELERLARHFPPGLEYEVATDNTLIIRESIEKVLQTLAEAIALVILVIFLFLHGFRSVLITALTLPVSLVGTFIFVKLFGFSINTLTLFGLTLATGLVVDDAIVVIENIERVRTTRKLGAVQASLIGIKEVGSAVVAISIALVAVFVPVALFPGTTGIIYRQFALTLMASVGISAFCALTLTPALSAKLLGGHAHDGKKWVVFRKVDQGLDAFRRRYLDVLRRVLRRPGWALAVFLLLALAAAALYRLVPTSFIPDEDMGTIIVTVQGPEGMALAQTRKVLDQVHEVLQAQPEISSMMTVGGFSLGNVGPNYATVWVRLKPWSERRGKAHSVESILERMREPLGKIGEARVVPFQPPTIRGVGSIGGFELMVEDVSGSRDLGELSQVAQELIGRANQDPRLRGVFTTFTSDTPILEVEVDRQKALALGVPVDSIYHTLQLLMGSQYVNDFDFASRTYRVYAQADQQFRDTPQDILAFYVRSDQGQMIPLESLVTLKPGSSAQIIRRHNMFRAAEINGRGAPGVSTGGALRAMEEIAREVLPEGMSAEWSGLSLEQKQSGGQTLLIFGLGILFVFLVLAAQYESFKLPFVIVLAVPLAVLGALGLQAARGLPNDVFCQVGLVMLIGLASKNAILIVEFAEQMRRNGRSVVDAVIEASGVRLRPILMTSAAFLLGVVPLMLATGAGALARNSLGTAVFGGMLVSTLVNLVFTPVLYVIVQRLPIGASARTSAGDLAPETEQR